MGLFRTTLALTGWGSLAAVGTFVAFTRKCKIEPLAPTDYLFQSTLFARFNPSNAPVTHDVCKRKVSLQNIRPELLEKEGKLTEAFCAGVWSGLGYAYQRRFLEKKYRGSETATQLWDRTELKASTYEVGTIITDHFEVVAKTPESIIVRCGDSPRVQDVRASDGLFEMTAEINKEEGVAEFSLKCVFYNGLAQPDSEGKPPSPPMPPTIQWLHQQYDKVLLESALSNVTKTLRG